MSSSSQTLFLQCHLRMRTVLGICAQIHVVQRQNTDEILGVIKKGNLPVSKATFYYATLNHEQILTNQRGAPKTAGP